MKTDSVLTEVLQERLKQEQKWGQQNHPAIEYCAILGEEVGEVNKAALEAHFGYPADCPDNFDYGSWPAVTKAPELHKRLHWKSLRKELIQTAAVAVAMVESLDRNELKE